MRVDHFKEARTQDVDHVRRIRALHLVAVSRDHHLVSHVALFLQLEVEQGGVLSVHLHTLLLRFIAHGRDAQGIAARL